MYNSIQKSASAQEKHTKKRLLKETLRRIRKGNIGDRFRATSKRTSEKDFKNDRKDKHS